MRVNFAYLLDKFLVPIIYVIIFIKGMFLFSAISGLFVTHIFGVSEITEKLSLIKEQAEFMFIFLTSILMIAIFNPWQDNLKYIDSHVKLLFYLFGAILIFTAKWNIFFHESIIFKKITNALN